MNYRILKRHETVLPKDMIAISLESCYSWFGCSPHLHFHLAKHATDIVKAYTGSKNAYIRMEI